MGCWALGAGRWQEKIRTFRSILARAQSPEPIRCAAPKIAFAILTATALSGCGNIEPWVKPYERQQLADPIMAFDPNPISTAYIHHVFEAREGARGALGSAGGGCGCN
jgi:hypothetical protein